jgi:HEAT repeat protein
VGRSRQAAALDQLAAVLGRDPDLDGLVLTQMGRLGGLADPLEAWDVCYAVRGFLDDRRTGVRREAIVTLGKLRDGEATPQLLALLDDEQAGLRKSALWALKEITGIDLGEDPARWRAWYREELVWWEQDYPGVVEVLRHGSPEEIGPAVATLTLKRLFRNSIADDLKQLLSHEAPELRVRACVALRELGSHVPVVDLTAALNDPDEKVRAAALDALRAITGLDLPADHDRWVEALGDDR